MTYLLDTNACILHLRSGAGSPIAKRLSGLKQSDVAINAVVRSELLYGAMRGDSASAKVQLALFLAAMPCLPIDEPCADAAAHIRHDLAVKGTPIGPYDLLIAATAIAYSLTLVTHNTREYARVTGLRLEDWQTSLG